MQKILFLLLSLAFFSACKDSKKENALMAIKQHEKNLMANLSQMNVDSARALIKLYDAFVVAYPKDTSSANILFKSADISRGIGEFGKAIKYWGDMRENFPNYRLTPDAMFLEAFTFENDLGDKENAKRFYEKFLAKYPKHALAADAQKSIEIMDMPMDQLIKQFEEKNKAELGK